MYVRSYDFIKKGYNNNFKDWQDISTFIIITSNFSRVVNQTNIRTYVRRNDYHKGGYNNNNIIITSNFSSGQRHYVRSID